MIPGFWIKKLLIGRYENMSVKSRDISWCYESWRRSVESISRVHCTLHNQWRDICALRRSSNNGPETTPGFIRHSLHSPHATGSIVHWYHCHKNHESLDHYVSLLWKDQPDGDSEAGRSPATSVTNHMHNFEFWFNIFVVNATVLSLAT